MSVSDAGLLIVSILTLVYLLVALLRPEKF